MTSLTCDFEKVLPTSKQIDDLFYLLGKREWGISRESIPSFEEHVRFVKKNPYRAWYLIKIENRIAGSVYLTEQNTLGLDYAIKVSGEILKETLQFIFINYEPLPPIPSVRNANFVANVATNNIDLSSALRDCGYSCIQETYRLSS